MFWCACFILWQEEEATVQRKPSNKEDTDVEGSSVGRITTVLSMPRSPPKNTSSAIVPKSEPKVSNSGDPLSARKQSSDSPKLSYESARLLHSAEVAVMSKPGTYKTSSPNRSEKPSAQQAPVAAEKTSTQHVPVMSRPLSAPLVPVSRPVAPVVSSMVQTPPLLARSVSSAGRLGPETSTAAHSYAPQSYRNVMMGSSVAGSSVGYTQPHSPSSGVNSSHAYSQPTPAPLPNPLLLSHNSERMEASSNKPSFPFGMINHDVMPNGQHWIEGPQRDSGNISRDHGSFSDIRSFDMYKPIQTRSQDHIPSEFPAGTSGRQAHGLADEFPHLDIINDLLEDDVIGKAAVGNSSFHSFSNGPQHLNRHYSFPGDVGMSNDLSPSTSSCRFDRTLSYHHDEGHHRSYVSLGGPTIRDVIPQSNLRPYSNGQAPINGMIPNQWQMAGNDSRSFVNMRNMDNDGFPYHIPPDYSNLSSGVNGYTVFRPSNGH